MICSVDHSALHRFAALLSVATLGLIGMGGLVTSHEAGLAVPDWPTSYGYNLFLFPVSHWVGGIFYEHTHRLAASLVGLLTVILAVWIWLREARSWVHWLGWAAVLGVVIQGVLGGLRVTLLKDHLGIVHAALAQMLLVLISAITLFTSRWWKNVNAVSLNGVSGAGRAFRLVLATAVLVLVQLILGAAMRHQHAGLAIPDFPLAYGRLWPPTDAVTLAAINRDRMEAGAPEPVSALQINLHLAHRLNALAVLIGVMASVWAVWRQERGQSCPSLSGPTSVKRTGLSALLTPFQAGRALARLALIWLGLTLGQVLLGAFTIWSHKAADVATAHVVLGAAILVTGSTLALMLFRCVGVKNASGSHIVRPVAEPGPSIGLAPSAAPARFMS